MGFGGSLEASVKIPVIAGLGCGANLMFSGNSMGHSYSVGLGSSLTLELNLQ